MFKKINWFWFWMFVAVAAIAYAATNYKLSELTELATEPDGTDQLYINDGGTSKKIEVQNLRKCIPVPFSAADATPSVLNGNCFELADITEIIKFDDLAAGYPGLLSLCRNN